MRIDQAPHGQGFREYTSAGSLYAYPSDAGQRICFSHPGKGHDLGIGVYGGEVIDLMTSDDPGILICLGTCQLLPVQAGYLLYPDQVYRVVDMTAFVDLVRTDVNVHLHASNCRWLFKLSFHGEVFLIFARNRGIYCVCMAISSNITKHLMKM